MRIRRLTLTVLVTLGVLSGAGLLWSAAALAAVETPVTEAATAITGTTATLHGEPNPNTRATVGYEFHFNSNGSCEGNTVGGVAPAELLAGTKVETPVTGLEGSSEYTFCIVAFNEAGETATGTALKFKTATIAPVIAAESESAVTPFDAVLEGQVNTERQETSYHYEYSSEKIKVEKGQGTQVGEGSLPGTSGVQGANPADIGGALMPNTAYYYRVVATNATGTTGGPVEHFTTLALEKPKAETLSGSAIGDTTVTLSSEVNPEFQALSNCEFQFDTEASFSGTSTGVACNQSIKDEVEEISTSPGFTGAVLAAEGHSLTVPSDEFQNNLERVYGDGNLSISGVLGVEEGPKNLIVTWVGALAGKAVAPVTIAFGEHITATVIEVGNADVNADASIQGLEPNTTYYYRLRAENAMGTSESAPQSFLTLPDPPVVLTEGASEVSTDSASIAGSVNPGSTGVNSETTYYFQYSTDLSYSSQMPLAAVDAGQGVSPVLEHASLTGLKPDTTYHYRIVASNDNTNTAGGAPQVVHGQGATFTTLATPPLLGPASASAITQNTATIGAMLDAQGLPTHWELRLSDTQGSLDPLAGGNTTGSASEALAVGAGSLSPGTTYYYKLIATNADGTVETPEGSFTTAPAPPSTNVNLFATPPVLSIPANVFPAEQAGTTKTTTKTLSKAQKLKNALKACAKEKPKGKRTNCEGKAHRQYGPVKKTKKK
jgi:hypothetical protein